MLTCTRGLEVSSNLLPVAVRQLVVQDAVLHRLRALKLADCKITDCLRIKKDVIYCNGTRSYNTIMIGLTLYIVNKHDKARILTARGQVRLGEGDDLYVRVAVI